MDSLEIILTGDGSHSLLNKQLNETYHSVHGALRESKHVFIKEGLEYWLQRNTKEAVNIFEVGFGTGLNAFLSVLFKADRLIKYTTLEAFPIDKDVWSILNYASADDAKLFEQLHQLPWNTWNVVNPAFHFLKVKNSLQQILLTTNAYDIIFFDAFAPNKQPEMWELPMLEKITNSMAHGGVFVTYCAKGQLKRDLKSLGLSVETLAGPPGKKEMVRAIKLFEENAHQPHN